MRRVLVVLVTVVVAAGLAACGDGGEAAGSDRDSKGRLRLPVGASGGGGGGERDEAMSASQSGADAMIAPARAVEYRLTGDAEAPAKSAAAYRLTAAKSGTDDAKQIGKALRVDDLDGVEVQDGIGWYYGRGHEGSVSSGTAVACTPEGKCPEPPAPAPPAGLPSAAQAERRFREILNDLGVDVAAGSIEVAARAFDVRAVTFIPSVEGVEVLGLETSIAFGENGRVEYANGFLGSFDKLGEYPLIGLEEAVERFQKDFAFDGGGGRALEGVPGDVEKGAASGRDIGGGDSGAGGTSAGGSPPDAGQSEPSPGCSAGETCVDPGRPSTDEPTMTIEPQEPLVPLEPEIVEITGADLVLQVVYPRCEGGEFYLVPSYRLLPEDTAGFIVTAVEEESLALASEPGADGRDDESCPGDEPGDVPVGKPDDVPMGRPEPAPRATDEPHEPAPLPPDDGREPAKP